MLNKRDPLRRAQMGGSSLVCLGRVEGGWAVVPPITEIFGVRPRLVGIVASDQIFVRPLVFSGLFDRRQKKMQQ